MTRVGLDSLDLGMLVSRDESKPVRFGTYGIVFEGTLKPIPPPKPLKPKTVKPKPVNPKLVKLKPVNPGQTKVAVKVVRYDDKSPRPALEVSGLYALFSAMFHNMIRNYSTKSMFGLNLTTKMSLHYLGLQLHWIIRYLWCLHGCPRGMRMITCKTGPSILVH